MKILIENGNIIQSDFMWIIEGPGDGIMFQKVVE